MKTPPIILIVFLFWSILTGGDFHLQLKVRSVYIVPMANGLDRHLASRLTSSGAVRVVLVPESADAVFTDRVDEAFWIWSNARYKLLVDPSNADPGDDDRFKYEHPRMGGYRGTVFLVDPRNGVVLWSMYEPTPDSSPKALDQAAVHVAINLRKSLSAK